MHLSRQCILFSAVITAWAASGVLAQTVAQKALPGGENAAPLLMLTSTFVSVPAMARNSSGELLDHWRTDQVPAAH